MNVVIWFVVQFENDRKIRNENAEQWEQQQNLDRADEQFKNAVQRFQINGHSDGMLRFNQI